jgi:hypothetical protein
MRSQRKLGYRLLLKTVIMEQNLGSLAEVARYATRDGMEVLYQPIEQNYNTAEDPTWFATSPTWPRDPEAAVHAVRELIQLKRGGLHIANSEAHFDAMIRYFLDPASWQRLTQAHVAQQNRPLCAALTMLQLESNGDVTVCNHRPPVGNLKDAPIRRIWERRTRYWEGQCCLVGDAAGSLPVNPSQSEPAAGERSA